MRTATDGFVDVPGGYLYYQQQGHGPDVVLINGGNVDLRMWTRPSPGSLTSRA